MLSVAMGGRAGTGLPGCFCCRQEESVATTATVAAARRAGYLGFSGSVLGSIFIVLQEEVPAWRHARPGALKPPACREHSAGEPA